MEFLLLSGIVMGVFAFFMGVFLLKEKRASSRTPPHRCDGGKTPTGCSHCGGPVRTPHPRQHGVGDCRKDVPRNHFPVQNDPTPGNTRKDGRADDKIEIK